MHDFLISLQITPTNLHSSFHYFRFVHLNDPTWIAHFNLLTLPNSQAICFNPPFNDSWWIPYLKSVESQDANSSTLTFSDFLRNFFFFSKCYQIYHQNLFKVSQIQHFFPLKSVRVCLIPPKLAKNLSFFPTFFVFLQTARDYLVTFHDVSQAFKFLLRLLEENQTEISSKVEAKFSSGKSLWILVDFAKFSSQSKGNLSPNYLVTKSCL